MVTTPDDLRRLTSEWTCAGERVGLVPTMGSLHRGHVSLVEAAQRECSKVVVSVFVNPLQFGVGEDYLTYPRQLEADLALLARQKVPVCYCPEVETLYPKSFGTKVVVEAGGELWEAARRPGHFTGVATVVAKLFAATGPCRSYFGEKDAQQAAVVQGLAQDLDLGVEVVVCPTVRDPDGVAISSRNQLLSKGGRVSARCFPRALIATCERFGSGVDRGADLAQQAARVIEQEPGVRLDYAGVVDPSDFQPVEVALSGSRILVAGEIEGVHLIDTCLISTPPALSR